MKMLKQVHLPNLELIRLGLLGKECKVEWMCGSKTVETITDYRNGTFYFDESRNGSSWWYAKYCRVIWK